MTTASFSIRYYDPDGQETEDRAALVTACAELEKRLVNRISSLDPASQVSRESNARHVSFSVLSPAADRSRVLEIILEDLDFLDLLQWSEKISCS